MRAESFVDDFNSTQRETYNLLRMTSISFELDKGDKNYENYDYYSEIGNLYN